MHKKYGPKGVVLLALSDEPKGIVQKAIRKHRINYIVGSGARPTLKAFGVRGFPTVFVVDPDGKVVYKGHSADEAETTIEATLKEKPPKKDGGLEARAAAEALADADKLFKRRKYAEAYEAYERIGKSFANSPAAAKARTRLKEMDADRDVRVAVQEARAGKKCKLWLSMAREMTEKGDVGRAREYYERIVSEFPESSFAQTARQEAASLRG
jgi:tetratricopeptide (TPR) repeat protein